MRVATPLLQAGRRPALLVYYASDAVHHTARCCLCVFVFMQNVDSLAEALGQLVLTQAAAAAAPHARMAGGAASASAGASGGAGTSAGTAGMDGYYMPQYSGVVQVEGGATERWE